MDYNTQLKDNLFLLHKLMEERNRKACILGFSNYSNFKLYDNSCYVSNELKEILLGIINRLSTVVDKKIIEIK